MKTRIFSNWTFTRALYLVAGILVSIQAVMAQQWLGVLFGGYFAAMGLFSFGCAAGNCAVRPSQQPHNSVQDVEFEEVK